MKSSLLLNNYFLLSFSLPLLSPALFYIRSLLQPYLFVAIRLFISCVLSINLCRFQINAYTQSGMWIHVKSIVDFIYFRFYDRAIRSRLTFHPLYTSLRSPSLILCIPSTTCIRVCVCVCMCAYVFPLSTVISWSMISFVGPSVKVIGPTFKGLSVSMFTLQSEFI